MKCAVIECYESFKLILDAFIAEETERRIIGIITREVENNIIKHTFLVNFRQGHLLILCDKFVQLVQYLRDADPSKEYHVVLLLQDMLDIVTRDMMVNENRKVVELGQTSKDSVKQLFANSDSKAAIVFPPKVTAQLKNR